MSFTERQRHCLDAMGIVAWVSDDNSVADLLPVPKMPDSDVGSVSDAAALRLPVRSSTDETMTNIAMPSAIDELANWLVRQPLTMLTYKGRQANYIGSENAALVIVCLQMEQSNQLPLSSECTQLFDLMMRAIDVPRTDFRQCSISTKPTNQDNAHDTAAGVYLEDIFTPHTRAVLVLDPYVKSESDMPQVHNTQLPSTSLPLWRIPHPDLLLKTPTLKRQAWEALKGLRQVHDNHAR